MNSHTEAYIKVERHRGTKAQSLFITSLSTIFTLGALHPLRAGALHPLRAGALHPLRAGAYAT